MKRRKILTSLVIAASGCSSISEPPNDSSEMSSPEPSQRTPTDSEMANNTNSDKSTDTTQKNLSFPVVKLGDKKQISNIPLVVGGMIDNQFSSENPAEITLFLWNRKSERLNVGYYLEAPFPPQTLKNKNGDGEIVVMPSNGGMVSSSAGGEGTDQGRAIIPDDLSNGCWRETRDEWTTQGASSTYLGPHEASMRKYVILADGSGPCLQKGKYMLEAEYLLNDRGERVQIEFPVFLK